MNRLLTRLTALAALLALCLALLTGCGAQTQSKTPETTDAPAAAENTAVPETTDTPAPTEAPAPTATPEPPSTMPDPTPAPEKNGMYELLAGLYDYYHYGVAGSSLTAAWYAASIVDWGVQNGTEAVRVGCAAWDRPMVNEYGEKLSDKLNSVYTLALSFYGAGTGVLSDCGWGGEWSYSGGDVQQVFRMIYPALGLETPIVLRVYYPDSEVMYLRADGVILDGADMESMASALNAALTYRVFDENAKILSAALDGGELHLDLNSAFADQIRACGTSGELLTISGLVNTAIEYTGADAVRITVEGETLETGHNIYDTPLTFYEE
ncbi:MAG: GerMN domain-containing protein [Oscillospiraceae bacterium]|nr:GerMN domain-containing protein [Oscillospiraceae bacterium]